MTTPDNVTQKATHTAGEWRAHDTAVFLGTECIAITGTDARPVHEEIANAKVMAAAPDLLAAGEASLARNPAWETMMFEAIAKAKP